MAMSCSLKFSCNSLFIRDVAHVVERRSYKAVKRIQTPPSRLHKIWYCRKFGIVENLVFKVTVKLEG